MQLTLLSLLSASLDIVCVAVLSNHVARDTRLVPSRIHNSDPPLQIHGALILIEKLFLKRCLSVRIVIFDDLGE